MDNENEKIKLFSSDDEEDNSDYVDHFKIRPQFQGPHGQQLLELSAQLPKRFKLDERFAEVFEPEYTEDVEGEANEEIEKEQDKNIRILESVLGHEVCPKTLEKNKLIKKQIRFDPEDENASHLVKNLDTTSEKPKKSKKKKKLVQENAEKPIPISTERYIDVCPDLKEILNTATPFTFTQQFSQFPTDIIEDSINSNEESFEPVKEIETLDSKRKRNENEFLKPPEKLCSKQIYSQPKAERFFISEGDPRLKEGIEFFKRPRPLDEIRIDWQKRRERVLELFRRKKRSSLRSRPTKVKSTQNKFAARKLNYKK